MTAPTSPADSATAPAEGTPAPAAVDATAPVHPATPPAPAPSPASMPQQQANPAPEGDEDSDGDDADTNDSAARRARREARNLRDRLKAESEAREALAQQVAQITEKANKADALEQTLAKLAAVFNPQASEEPVDPAKLAEQLAAEKAAAEQAAAATLAERDAQIRALTVKAALPGAMSKAGADPDLTLAVLTASGALSKLDPSAEGFAADLESAVKSAVDSNPKLKAAQAAVRSGAEIPGRSGGSDQVTREQLARMSPTEIEKARVEGRLRNLLSGG